MNRDEVAIKWKKLIEEEKAARESHDQTFINEWAHR